MIPSFKIEILAIQDEFVLSGRKGLKLISVSIDDVSASSQFVLEVGRGLPGVGLQRTVTAAVPFRRKCRCCGEEQFQ